jgi:hypothetical protein
MSEQFEGFDSPGTTAVPDYVFDFLLEKLTGNELKALMYIIRRTFGFGKSADAISLSQFREGIKTKDGKVLNVGCGIGHNRLILAALTGLEKKGYVVSQKREATDGSKDTTIYKLRFKKAEQVVTPSNEVVTSGNQGGSYFMPQGVVTSGNQQETHVEQETQNTYDADASRTLADYSLEEIATLLRERGYSITNQPELSTPDTANVDNSPEQVATCNPIASDTPEAPTQNENGSHEQPAPGKKPRTPAKPLDETTKARVERVFSYFDKLKQEMTGDSEAKYVRTKTAISEVKDTLLPCAPTEQRLRKVYMALWNTPRDTRSGFEWKKNMTIKAVCGQYEARVIDIIAEEKREIEKKRDQERYMSPTPPIAPVEDDLPFDIERHRSQRRRIGNRQVV